METLEIKLTKYEQRDRDKITKWIAEFYGFHASLISGKSVLSEGAYEEAKEILEDWLAPNHELYIINKGQEKAGFLHLDYRGDIVAWIEDLFVDTKFRGQKIATTAIRMAEEIIKSKSGYTAVCMDVAPRNKAAVKLYHKLGYDSLSLVTVRKEFYENKRDRVEEILGLDFKI
ncbi:GNAT family N-acetyltransferase [Roseburia hominis]